MSGLIKLSGIEDEKCDSVIGIIDKMEKVRHEELRDMLREIEISDEKIDKLLDLFDKMTKDKKNKVIGYIDGLNS